jgi:hypothetical protein
MVGRELRQDAEVAAERAVDHDSAGQPEGAQDFIEDVHARSLQSRRSGVSINLSGNPVILANRAVA